MRPEFKLSLICIVLLAVLAAAAQVPSAVQSRPRVSITRHDGPNIRVDGKLDEPVWATLSPITQFIQTDPNEGAPVSERTEALVFYDAQNIYFGFRCYDSEPSKIIHRYGPHDGRTNSDSINIFIDTFHDQRTGYFFSVNSRGIQYDATTNEARGNGWEINDGTWDGIWYSAAAQEPWGYSVEVVIPFKSIRLSRDSVQDWGLNLGRDIVRKNENANWSAVSRFDQTMKPSKAGTLSGLEGVRVGRNLELIPYGSTGYRSAPWSKDTEGVKNNAGLDLRYGLASNLTLSATVNPDFGETEADEFNPTLSRFEIFFPEKRKFFTEGANYFATPLELFFSRRVGSPLPDGEPQRILEGGKLTGKVGPWTIGVLEAVTQRVTFLDPALNAPGVAPSAFFGVVRVKRDIWQKSSIGFISVNRLQQSGEVGAQETSHGIDLNILKGEHVTFNAAAMVNTNSTYGGMNAQHLGWTSQFLYNSDLWEYEAVGKFLGREVDLSHTGFEPETDRWAGQLRVRFKPFINRWGMRQIFAELNYDESNGTRGELEDAGADGEIDIQFKNFWMLKFRHSYDRVRFNEFSTDPLTGDFFALIPTRVYTTPRNTVTLSTNENRRLYATVSFVASRFVQFDENFYGHERRIEVTTSARISDHLRWEITAVNSRESLLNGHYFQDRTFVISRWNYQFTPKLRARTLAQYASDRHGHDLSLNSLLAYDFTARSAAFVGYNRQRRSPGVVTDLGNQFFVKLSYLFSF